MKIEITESGMFDAGGKELEIGSVFEIDGDVLPSAFLNKCRMIGETLEPKKLEVATPKNKASTARASK